MKFPVAIAIAASALILLALAAFLFPRHLSELPQSPAKLLGSGNQDWNPLEMLRAYGNTAPDLEPLDDVALLRASILDPLPEDENDSACKQKFKALIQQTVENLETSLARRESLIEESCRLEAQAEFPDAVMSEFLSQCVGDLKSRDEDYLTEVCMPLISLVRFVIVKKVYGQSKVNPRSLSAANLLNQLAAGFANILDASEEEVLYLLRVAKVLTEKEPNLYPAYKATLLATLILELKFKKQVKNSDLSNSYGQLLRFKVESEDAELEFGGLDPDLVHIPFLRLSAQNDLKALAVLAEEYTRLFPDSQIGQIYLAEANWRLGDKPSALFLLKNSFGEDTTQEIIEEMLSSRDEEAALNTILDMGIEW